MKTKAESLDISVKYKIMSKADEIIQPFDLCTIVSNLLQNAIEACEKVTSDKWIKCTFYNYNGHFAIMISNPVNDDIKIKDDILITSKPDSFNHGLGSLNVKRAVERYDGRIRYTCENNIFNGIAVI